MASWFHLGNNNGHITGLCLGLEPVISQQQILERLSAQIGKPLAERKAKRVQAARDAYQQIQQGNPAHPILTDLLHNLKGKTYKGEREALKQLIKEVPVPPLRLKWPYPLVPWD